MISLKQAAGAAALVVASGAASAGVSGNVGVVSDYMFRGVSQTSNVIGAVQGGLDWESGFGLYAGTWASNITFAGGTEQDFYVGFAKEAGALSFDVGLVYYWYPEEKQGPAGGDEFSTAELGASVGFGPVSLSAAYADEANFFLGDGMAQDALYLALGLDLPIAEGLNVTGTLGHYSGDEIDRVFGDSYIEFGLGLAKELDAGMSATMQYIGTDLTNDDAKFVVGLSKSFDL